jgi:chloramphenicol 3-O-phosphotransferase
VDAVVAAGSTQARVVFAHDAAGLLTWLDVYLQPDRFDGVAGGRIIVVNGPSGAGKSTLMRALQSLATFPLVVLDEPEQIGTVQPGYLIWRDRAPSLHSGYLAAIATLARAGNHVAVSAAGHPHQEIADAFEDMFVVTVGLTCEFEVLCERERRTGRGCPACRGTWVWRTSAWSVAVLCEEVSTSRTSTARTGGCPGRHQMLMGSNLSTCVDSVGTCA